MAIFRMLNFSLFSNFKYLGFEGNTIESAHKGRGISMVGSGS